MLEGYPVTNIMASSANKKIPRHNSVGTSKLHKLQYAILYSMSSKFSVHSQSQYRYNILIGNNALGSKSTHFGPLHMYSMYLGCTGWWRKWQFNNQCVKSICTHSTSSLLLYTSYTIYFK